MGNVKMYNPEALTMAQQDTDKAVAALSALLKRKAGRADALREEAAANDDQKAFDRAAAIDREVLLLVDVVQKFNALIEVHTADNESAWPMIALQDVRCEALKRKAAECQDEAARNAQQFDQLHEAFTAYVAKQISTDGTGH